MTEKIGSNRQSAVIPLKKEEVTSWASGGDGGDRMEAMKFFAQMIAEEVSSKRQEAKSAGFTVNQLFERFIEMHAKLRLKRWKDYQGTYQNHIHSRFGDLDALAVTRADVVAWHADLRQRVGLHAANRAQQLLRSAYNRAIEWEILPRDSNPASGIRKFRETPRERFIQEDEFPRWFAAVNQLRYTCTRDFFLMLLFTSARKSNVRDMSWNQIDFARKVWTIPCTKNGTSQTLPLVPEALEILERRRSEATCEWVFESSYHSGKRIKWPSRAWTAVLKNAGIEHLTLHDLRRTHAAYQAITGANTLVIAATLNHKCLQSTQIYARLNVKPVADAMDTAVGHIMAAAGIERSNNSSVQVPAEQVNNHELARNTGWVTEKEAATILGMPLAKLRYLRYREQSPSCSNQPGGIRYHVHALQSWTKGRKYPAPA